MLTKNFHQLQAEVQRHVAADQVAQGSHKTRFFGWLAKQSNFLEFIESEYGIPKAVSRVAESIFEGLPSDEAAAFFAASLGAVESDGKDLSRVVWQFLSAELRSLPPATPEFQAVIDPVIDGMGLLAQGKEWPEEGAKAAAASAAIAAWTDAYAVAAWTDAYAVAYAAADAYAAWAALADDAADLELAAISVHKAVARARQATALADGDPILARRRQRDTLLKLIKEAPITLEENS